MCDGIDDDDAARIPLGAGAGKGAWAPKRGVTIRALKDACWVVGDGVRTSGTKDMLVAGLRHAWKTRGFGTRIRIAGASLMRGQTIDDAKNAFMEFGFDVRFCPRRTEHMYALSPGTLTSLPLGLIGSVASAASSRR